MVLESNDDRTDDYSGQNLAGVAFWLSETVGILMVRHHIINKLQYLSKAFA